MTGKRRKSEKIRVNPCKSMRKIINEKNLRDKLIFSEKKKTAEKKKIRGKQETKKPQKSFEI